MGHFQAVYKYVQKHDQQAELEAPQKSIAPLQQLFENENHRCSTGMLDAKLYIYIYIYMHTYIDDQAKCTANAMHRNEVDYTRHSTTLTTFVRMLNVKVL